MWVPCRFEIWGLNFGLWAYSCFPRPCLVAGLAHIGWPRPLERLSEYTYYQTEAQKAPHGAPHGPGVAARRCPPQLPGDEIVG